MSEGEVISSLVSKRLLEAVIQFSLQSNQWFPRFWDVSQYLKKPVGRSPKVRSQNPFLVSV
jgi:hypothetical protein